MREMVEKEWRDQRLVQRLEQVQLINEDCVKENKGAECSINIYRNAARRKWGREACLRQQAEDKKREADRLRGEAGQRCIHGMSYRALGNMAHDVPSLQQVEQLLTEVEECNRQVEEFIGQIERDADDVQRLITSLRGEIRQDLAEMRHKQTQLGSQLSEVRKEAEENQWRVDVLFVLQSVLRKLGG